MAAASPVPGPPPPPPLPKKANFRQRAHCNPLSDGFIAYPRSPDHVDWAVHFPRSKRGEAEPPVADSIEGKAELAPGAEKPTLEPKLQLNTYNYPVTYPADPVPPERNGSLGDGVTIVDVGCGYGGLLMSLANVFPTQLMLGMEIRESVTEFVGLKIASLRAAHAASGAFSNISVVRTNAMKFLVNYIRGGSLEKLFFCFPDPHFKKCNTRRRIVSAALLTVYAYLLKQGGLIYTVTDVEELHEWMRSCQRSHPLFEEVAVSDAYRELDPCVNIMERETEESKKVARNGKPCWSTVFRRR